jgi:DNA-binding protein HU-beta
MAKGSLKSSQNGACDSLLFQPVSQESACNARRLGKPSAPQRLIAVDSMAAQERNGPMTKNELIAAVAGKAQMTKTAAASAVEATFDAITSTLKRGGEVKIMGFGNFRVVKRAAREGRDPRTGNPVKIKAAKRPRFSAGKGLKEAVNR